MGKEQAAMQNHLSNEFKASQQTMPGCDYVYDDKQTKKALLKFFLGNIDHKCLYERGDIVIGIDSEIPDGVLSDFISHLEKNNQGLAKRLVISDDAKTILIKSRRK